MSLSFFFKLLALCGFILLSGGTWQQARARTVELPITLDYNLLGHLLRQHAFPERNNSSVHILGDRTSCNQIRLDNPVISPDSDNLLKLDVDISLRGGKQVGQTCLLPTSWSGHLVLLQRPVFDPLHFTLRFTTVRNLLYTNDGHEVELANILLEMAKPKIQEYLDQIEIQLAPSITHLENFLRPLFPSDRQEEVNAMLGSIRGGNFVVYSDALHLSLLADVTDIYDPTTAQAKASLKRPISPELISLWETWDSFLVELVADLAIPPLSDDDREVLVDVILDTRYAFSAALSEGNTRDDFVRKQFISAWKMLAPVFRRQLYSRANADNYLDYLALFTAADALVVLDRVGPTLGIEISRAGLERLAQILRGPGTILHYNKGIDPRLRQLFDLPQEEDAEPQSALPGTFFKAGIKVATFLQAFLLPTASASELPTFAEIAKWKFDGHDATAFLQRVRTLLTEETEKVMVARKLPQAFHAFFPQLVQATAWQESCYRQFVNRGGKLNYLLSYNNTSVGLMQVNERVWRGIYRVDKLRWDIHYNARAGTEIIDRYLQRYVLRKGDKTLLKKAEYIAGAVYAIYNGGPGQFEKFTRRWQNNKRYRSDTLFATKYTWVVQEQWDNIDQCLGP